MMELETFARPIFIGKSDQNQDYYDLLQTFGRKGGLGADGLLADLGEPQTWVAYAVKVGGPRIKLSCPYQQGLSGITQTRILLVVSKPHQNDRTKAENEFPDATTSTTTHRDGMVRRAKSYW